MHKYIKSPFHAAPSLLCFLLTDCSGGGAGGQGSPVVSPPTPPTVNSQPQSQMANAGSSITLSASANGTSPTLSVGFQLPSGIALLAGSSEGPEIFRSYQDGKGSQARVDYPLGVAVSMSGNVYVADTNNNTIRKITADGTTSTYAGAAGPPGYVDGTTSAARFAAPEGIAVDSAETLYVADFGNCAIRKITAVGVVSTLAGNPANCADNKGSAQFGGPTGIALDGSGNVYVADPKSEYILKIDAAGDVTTLAGTRGVSGATDGSAASALFNQPSAVATDSQGNVYVADAANSAIRMISTQGNVTTLAGAPGMDGYVDGTGNAARFSRPVSLAVDLAGNLFVADYDYSTIRQVSPAGVVTTVAGTPRSIGMAFGPLPGVMWPPLGIAVYPDPVGSKLVVAYAAAILTINLH